MAINLITWANQTVTPKDDAIVQDACAGRSGILYGCGVTASGNTLTVASGYGIIKGRLFEVTSDTLSITLPSSGTLKGVLYIRLDLANSSEPIEITAMTGSTEHQMEQDANANFDSGVYEMELAKFDVTRSGISNLVASESKVPYNRSPVYQSMADLGIGASTYISTIWGRMANNSIAILDERAIATLPYSGATGTVLIIKKEEARPRTFFLTAPDEADYQWHINTWIKLPHYTDLYCTMNENVNLRFCGSGYITSGGTQLVFSVPNHKKLQPGRSCAFSTGSIVVRQNGNYLAGSGNTAQSITEYAVTFYVYNNIIKFILTANGGFGGVNNEVCAVDGNVVLIEN